MLAWQKVLPRGTLSSRTYEQYLHREAWKLLRNSLKKVYDIELSEGDLFRNHYGKPYLKYYPDLYFNLTHCEEMTACIISENEAGIDIEKIRPLNKRVLKKVFSQEEMLFLQSEEIALSQNTEASQMKIDEYFFRLWTLKESYIKAIGRGLSFPMKEISFHLSGREWVSRQAQGYIFKQLKIENRFVLSWCENREKNRGGIG